MRRKTKVPIVLAALLFLLAAVAEIAMSRSRGPQDDAEERQRRAVVLTVEDMGGPEMAPHIPQRSSHPGEAGARLDNATDA
jgi:hypothetical protein